MSVSSARSMVLVTHYFPAHGGGIEIVANQIATRLAGSGAWTIAWFASDVDPGPDVVPGLMTTAARSWNAVERRTGLPFPLWSIGSLRALWVAVRDADLVHVHDYLYLGNLAAIIAGWRWGKPVVVTQHIGLIPFASRIKRLTLELLNRTIGALFLRHVHQVVFISEAVRTYFEARVTFTRRPAYLPNGVDGALFHPVTPAERQQLRQELGLPRHGPVLLFVGRFVEKKGVHIVAELARRNPTHAWMVAGQGPLEGVWSGLVNVRVLSGRSGATLAPLYQAADLLVLPSIGEGFPLVVQESMASGTPVMISESTAAGCPSGESLFFAQPVDATESTVAHWSKRLSQILESGEELGTRRAAVAQFSREHWSWERTTGGYDGLFQALVRGRSRGGDG
jgi:glycosyltransferase involved in cell wall biosynthesis